MAQQNVLPGVNLRYVCNQGFVVVGSSNNRCSNQGVWLNQPPTCVLGEYEERSVFSMSVRGVAVLLLKKKGS